MVSRPTFVAEFNFVGLISIKCTQSTFPGVLKYTGVLWCDVCPSKSTRKTADVTLLRIKKNEKTGGKNEEKKKKEKRKKRRYAINVPYPLNVILLDIAPSIRQTTPAD